MNIDDAMESPAVVPQEKSIARSLFIPLAVATIAGCTSLFVGAKVFQSANRSTQLKIEADRQKNAQDAAVTAKLISSYNAFSAVTPAGSNFGALTTDEKRDLEFAMRDVYLYGNAEVSKAADKWFKSKFKSPVEGVLLPLRNQIRSLSGLAPSAQTNSPWIQTFWRTELNKSTSAATSTTITK